MWSAAPAVAEIAGDLIVRHHPHLAGVPIVFIFREKAYRSRGRMVLGRARVVRGLDAFLTALAAGEAPGPDEDDDCSFFVMEISEDWWDEAAEAARAAVVDHELCHFAVDYETGDLSLRGHDLEEFNAVVERHGMWREDVTRFFGACSSSTQCQSVA